MSAKKNGETLQVDVRRLPHRAALVLEAERRERLVVRAARRDAGAEQVGVRDQVRGHQRAVAVAGDADAIGIDDPELDGLVDRRLRVVDELLEIRVVRLLRIADDRERRVVDDRVSGEEQQPVLRRAA